MESAANGFKINENFKLFSTHMNTPFKNIPSIKYGSGKCYRIILYMAGFTCTHNKII